MPGHDVVSSPILVGRQDVLDLAERRLGEAASGRGHVLLIAGEAGVGKSRLLASISELASERGFSELRSTAFPGDIDTSGAVLLDLAGNLRRSELPGAPRLGDAMALRLRARRSGAGDLHRRRRLLVQDLTDTFCALLLDRRLLVVLEDLHWADELSLEVVSRVAAALTGRTTLIAGALRTDELVVGTPLRSWRARLLATRLAEEVRLSRLDRIQSAELISALLGRRAPAQLVASIHERTDGIPLHVEELLAGAEGDLTTAADPDAVVAAIRVPASLADAVLARAAALDAPTRAVAAAAAVIGRSFDFDVLVAVSQEDPETLDRCLRHLSSSSLVRAGGDAVSFDFRHALIRDALYADLSVPTRRALHERVALVGVERGFPAAFVSAHFDLAGLAGPAFRHAVTAAHQATVESAHREAYELYRRALRNRPSDITSADHATLLADLAGEAAAIDDNAAAVDAYAEAHALWRRAGDVRAAAALVAPWTAALHLRGEPLDGRVGRLQKAVASLDGVLDGDVVRAQLFSALAAAFMLDRRLDEAIAHGERALALGATVGDELTGVNTGVTLGSVLVFAGDAAGWVMLEDAVGRSVRGDREAEAARGHRMIGSCASVLVEYARAEEWLTRGMAYAERVGLWNHRNYMAAHLAHVWWACGRWDDAQAAAEHALADGRGGVTTEITARYVLGYVAMGRGDRAAATTLLGAALEQGESMAELQRISPPLWGLAETALLSGDPDTAIALCERGYAASHAVADAAYLFPFLVTGMRAHVLRGSLDEAADWLDRVSGELRIRSIPGTLPAIDHARGLLHGARGDQVRARVSLGAAHAAWVDRRRYWEGSWAMLDLARCATSARRHAEAATLARVVAESARETRATSLGVAADRVLNPIATGPGRSRWHPLTDREHTVATLVAAGMTNREIAAELVVSPKTVSAHIEHILTKLGAGRRAEIAAWVSRTGL